MPIKVNLYESLVIPDEEKGGELVLNPNSIKTVQAYGEPCLGEAEVMDRFQFMRNGYFVADSKHHTKETPVFNRIVSLKSSFKPN